MGLLKPVFSLYKYKSIRHTPAIATESILLMYYSPVSQHVSAQPGHPQVNRNLLVKKAIVTPTDPLFLTLQMARLGRNMS
jgi:hypothetical protein